MTLGPFAKIECIPLKRNKLVQSQLALNSNSISFLTAQYTRFLNAKLPNVRKNKNKTRFSNGGARVTGFSRRLSLLTQDPLLRMTIFLRVFEKGSWRVFEHRLEPVGVLFCWIG